MICMSNDQLSLTIREMLTLKQYSLLIVQLKQTHYLFLLTILVSILIPCQNVTRHWVSQVRLLPVHTDYSGCLVILQLDIFVILSSGSPSLSADCNSFQHLSFLPLSAPGQTNKSLMSSQMKSSAGNI